ncbi:MFS transporter [Pseudonocardia sp. TRM90224]|uniref:MFS transporter n=1 Tax=Pseudonocardia sp. TRM90224 TaxID=2812678 RepID=UPI001E409705|nr:MFS transporter [Pseudonocardia sp. TRM90224]
MSEVSARAWWGLAVLALPTALLSMDATVLYLAVPHLAADLQPSSTELLWITDSYGFLIAAFLVPMGTLGDRIGRRKLLMIGAAAFAVISVLAAFAPSAELLIAARALLGVAGATLMPSTLALITTLFPDDRRRGVAIGIWAAALSGGAALGPVVGGLLLGSFAWGSVFLIAVPIMALLLVTGPFLLPEHRDGGVGRIDVPSIVLSLAAVLGVVYGLKQAADGDLGLVTVGAAVLGAAAAVVFVRRQRRLADPLVDLRLFADRSFTVALGVMLVAMGTTVGVYFFVTLHLQQVLGLSPVQAGLWLVPSAAVMIVSSTLAPTLAARFGAAAVVAGSLAVAAVGFALLAFVDAGSSVLLPVASLVVVYLGGGPVMTLATDLVVGAAPPERAGSASALSETGGELGLALGVALLGSVGIAVYRVTMAATLPAGLAPDVATAAGDTVDGATAAAAGLPAQQAADLLAAAREAFAGGVSVVGTIAAVLTAALAVLVAVVLRRRSAPAEPGAHAAA